jgi:hypothetical protein
MQVHAKRLAFGGLREKAKDKTGISPKAEQTI